MGGDRRETPRAGGVVTMTRCPKCRGCLATCHDETRCINCGWREGDLTRELGREGAREAALARMGLRSSADEWDPLRWELLAWFASFAARDLTHLADKEWGEVVSEVWVVEKLATLNLEPADLSRDAACKLQGKVRAVLTELCDNGVVRLGPFATEVVVYRGDIPKARIPAAQQALGVALMGRLPLLIGNAPREGVAFQLPPSGPDALLHCLAQLLHRYPGAVRRCPLCHALFAQFRKSAVFCSRKCQAVQAARDWRIAQKHKKSASASSAQYTHEGEHRLSCQIVI